MVKQTLKFIAFPLFILGCSLLHSCTPKEQAPDTSQASKGPVLSDSPGTITVNEVLYELHVDVPTYIKSRSSNGNSKALVLKYYLGDSGVLSLHGWYTKKNQNNITFDSIPNLKLNAGRKTAITLEQGDYVGNLSLTAKELTKIDSAIVKNPKLKYLLFIPTRKSPVRYQVSLSDEMTKTTSTTGILAIANPSPPRQIE